MKRIALKLWGLFVLLICISACGNGGGSTPGQQKMANIVFSTVSSAHTAPLQGILVSMKLPAGSSIANISTAVTGHNSSGQVAPGSYDPATNTATFAVALVPPSNFITFGDFASLTCNITSGATLNPSSFSLAAGDLQMTGKDVNGNSVNLVPQIPVTLSVSFEY